MSKRTYEEYIKNGCHPVGYNEPCQSYYFGQVSVDFLLDQIKQLKQQLDESFTEEDVDGLIEDRDKTIKFLQQQLDEKQNTIDKINKEFVQAVHDWKALCAEKDKEIATLKAEIIQECKEHQDIMQQFEQVEKQFAIQELEKVKMLTEWKFNSIIDVVDYIDQQIKELKGEKDVKD